MNTDGMTGSHDADELLEMLACLLSRPLPSKISGKSMSRTIDIAGSPPKDGTVHISCVSRVE